MPPLQCPRVGPALSLCRSLPAVVLCAAVLCGCGEEPQVVIRTLPMRDRMLAVIVPVEDDAWVLKMSGAAVFVSPLEEDFRAIAASMTLNEGTPKFELPDGWSQEGQSGMRQATLRPSEESPVEVTVTRLTTPGLDREELLTLNADRWRGELSLPPTSEGWSEAAREVGTLEELTVAGREASLLDLRGNIVPARMSVIQPAGRRGVVVKALTLPDGWKATGEDQFRLVIIDAGEDVEVTVSSSGGSPTMNVNRWRGQLGLEPADDAALVQEMTRVSVGGATGLQIEMTGEREGQPASIVGVITQRGTAARPRQYFVKMSGPPEAVASRAEAFTAFLESLDLG